MGKIIRLTESDLNRIVRKVIQEQTIAGNVLSGSSQKAVKQVFDSCRNVAISSLNTNKIVDGIYRAIQGMGTDESTILKALAGTNNLNTFCTVVKNYKTTYGIDLYSDLDGDIDQETVWAEISKVLRRLQQSPAVEPTRGGNYSRPIPGGVPQRPNIGGVPQRPGTGGVPQRPGTGGVPQRPGTGGVPQRPNIGGVPQRSGTGRVPQRPNIGGVPQSPSRTPR